MSKADRKGRTRGMLGSFVALPHYLLNSLAWRSLNMGERCAFIEVLKLYNGSNNGRLCMSGRVLARELRMSRATATRALSKLCVRGFLEVVKPSSFACKVKRAAEYRVTHFRCDATGELSSKAFTRWQPQIHFSAYPQSHNGLTTEPHRVEEQQNCRKVALT